MARKTGAPDRCRTLVFTEELCRTLTMPELVRHVMHSLPTAQTEHIARPLFRPAIEFKPAIAPPVTLELEYQSMRKSYEMRLASLKQKAVTANRPTSWLHLFGLTLQSLNIVRR